MLRNDYKGLMDRIEKGLHEHHANLAANPPAASASNPTVPRHTTATLPARTERPFAKVNTVENNSPAQAAGLKAGDSVLRFGAAIYANNEKLSKVAEVVSQNEGVRDLIPGPKHTPTSVLTTLQRPISVKVSRLDPITQAPEELSLQLTPRRNWGGRGLLGCHLLPV